MARTLARMERDGLVTRRPDTDDKRRSRVLLTRRARAMEQELEAQASEVNAVAVAGVSTKDVRTFMTVLGRIIENLDTDAAAQWTKWRDRR